MYEVPKTDLVGAFTFLPIEDVYYGAGAIDGLAANLMQHGIERALLITGNTLATKTKLVDRVMEASGGRIAAVFHETTQHVHRGSVVHAVEMARSHKVDGIISFGGGTPNDTGKAVVLGLAEGVVQTNDFDRFQNTARRFRCYA